jgi:2-oxoglutarate ferredoxin oxidoreductase subunit alpha
VEDCFYTAIEAVNMARQYNVPVFILSDQSIATRIETFEEPGLQKVCQDLTPDLSPVAGYTPYPLDGRVERRVAPGTPILNGQYPLASGLEHDEMGHPTGSPMLHMQMTARRRRKLQKLAETLPVPQVYGPPEGNILLVGWGSTQGPIREAVDRARTAGDSVSALNLRHLCPLPPGLENIFAGFNHIIVVEMNDEGLYGYGQLAGLLRARFCLAKIGGLNKTDGLTWRVREILERVKGHVADGLRKL